MGWATRGLMVLVTAMGATAFLQAPMSQPPFDAASRKAGPDGALFWTDAVTPMMHGARYNLAVATAHVRAALSEDARPLGDRRADLQAARAALHEALALRPLDGPAWTLLALVEARLGDPGAARRALIRSAAALPHSTPLAAERLGVVSLLRRSLDSDLQDIALADLATLRRTDGDAYRRATADRFIGLLAAQSGDGS